MHDQYQLRSETDLKWYTNKYGLHRNNQIKENPWILSQLLEQYIETN